MKDFFLDIFNYHHIFNQKLVDQLEENQAKIPGTCSALFSHILNAHQIWNARILGKTALGVHDLHTLDTCKKIDNLNHSDSSLIINTINLDSEIAYHNSKGDLFKNTTKDILFHINNHSTHHRAQIIATLRSLGISAIVTDYIFYKRMP